STVLCRPTAPNQQQVGGNHALDHRCVAEPIAHRLLVKMLAMRFPEPLTAQQPAEESDSGVREKVERQNDGCLPSAADGEVQQEKPQQITKRDAADIAEKYPRG